jgi:5-methylcytosine-specific restriction protein A
MSKRYCFWPNCNVVVEDGTYCNKHKSKVNKEHISRVGSVQQRGYTWQWKKLAKLYITKHRYCELCMQENKRTKAVEVDHIIPLSVGGLSVWKNLQSLCRSHHTKKTISDVQLYKGNK